MTIPRRTVPRRRVTVSAKPRKPYTPSEHSEQAALVAVCRSHPDMRLQSIFAVPNAGRRSVAGRVRMKAEGLLAGVPDIILPAPSADEQYHQLYLELKKKRGGVLSDAQKLLIPILRSFGNRVERVNGAKEAWEVICEHLKIDPSYAKF